MFAVVTPTNRRTCCPAGFRQEVSYFTLKTVEGRVQVGRGGRDTTAPFAVLDAPKTSQNRQGVKIGKLLFCCLAVVCCEESLLATIISGLHMFCCAQFLLTRDRAFGVGNPSSARNASFFLPFEGTVESVRKWLQGMSVFRCTVAVARPANREGRTKACTVWWMERAKNDGAFV